MSLLELLSLSQEMLWKVKRIEDLHDDNVGNSLALILEQF